MTRNLKHRIEVVFPVFDEEVKEEILQMIDCQLKDNVKARILDQDLKNMPKENYNKPPRIRAQIDFYQFLKKKYKT